MADRVYGRHIVEALKCEGSGWRGGNTGHGLCRCPAHNDSKASLSVKDTGERVVINCLAGETEVITRAGTRTIAELAGDTHELMTVGPGGGVWVDAAVRSFGVQKLLKITMERKGIEKVVFATAGHRWILEARSDAASKEKTTDQLVNGDRLRTVFRRRTGSVVSPFGIAHGFTYGDGSKTLKGSCQANFCGEKDQALLPYFPMSVVRDYGTYKRIGGLPDFFKKPPSLTENSAYLKGWLAGYFAADGCVDAKGRCSIASASRESLQAFKDIGQIAGIGTYGIRKQERLGFGSENSDLFFMSLRQEDLFPEFFIIPQHRARFEENRGETYARFGWIVQRVEPTDREEEVFCAEVPGTHSFVLADNLLTGNCFALCDFRDIVRELRAMGLWEEWDGNGERFKRRHSRRRSSVQRQAQAMPGRIPVPPGPEPEDDEEPDEEYISPEPEPDEIARRLAAREIWRRSRPIGDDAAKLYLWSRRIDIRRVPPTLRFSPSLFYSREEQLYPALIGAMGGEDRRVSAVQRIWVTNKLENVNGVGPANNKAPLASPKKTLGVMGDGAVRLAPADRTLGIAEGIETGLSAQQHWKIPVWVSCGAWRMDRIWIPAEVERIIIFGDNGEEGHKAAHKASLAYHARGLDCTIEFPPDEFNDWNDFITGNKRNAP